MNTSTNATPTLRIDMVSDIVCPWCTIGYERLQTAINTLQHEQPALKVDLCFQPFELNPQMPPIGQNVNEHIAQKYGSDDATTNDNRARIKALAAAEGLTFNTHSESRIYNTFLAHKLLHKAQELGTQQSLKLALFEAYFGQGKNISEPQVLIDIAVEHGFTPALAQQVIDDDAIAQAVREQQQLYTQMGVSAVPTYVFNQQFTVSGAQDAPTLANVLRDILNKTQG